MQKVLLSLLEPMYATQRSYGEGQHRDETRTPQECRPMESERYLEELGSHVVAAAGGHPRLRRHLGVLVQQGLRDAPDFNLQIQAGTGESETFGSMLRRSTRMACVFRAHGLVVGDVVVLMEPKHLDLAVPFYAALYEGVTVSAIDRFLGLKELQDTLSVTKPKVVFCLHERASDVATVLKALSLDTKVITFDGGDGFTSFQQYLQLDSGNHTPENYRCAEFDPATTVALVVATSGTTGPPKTAAVTHQNISFSLPYLWSMYQKFPTPTRLALIVSAFQWITAQLLFLCAPIYRFTWLQTTKPITTQHFVQLIDEYKPTWTLMNPTILSSLLRDQGGVVCDVSCFETIIIGGSAVSTKIIGHINKTSPSTAAVNMYGMSELAGTAFHLDKYQPKASSGKPIGLYEYRLIDVSTGADIYEANSPGELWIRGPSVFQGYCKNPEATAEVLSDDGWLKTGDLFYRDDNSYFYFIDRIKLLLKYKGHQISPVELEEVIGTVAGVRAVVVTGLRDAAGDLPVACVVRDPLYPHLTAQTIKDHVKKTLTDTKQLRGGVVFLDKIPLTSNSKVDRQLLKDMIQTCPRL